MPRTPARGSYGVGMDISRLRDRLIEIDYTTDSVLERIGQAGQAESYEIGRASCRERV